MRTLLVKHHVASLCVFSVLIMGLAACGGGGSGSDAAGAGQAVSPTNGGNGSASPTPTPSRDATRPGQVGTETPGTTPGPTEEPTEPVDIILRPGANIRQAARNAPDGATLILSAGMYPPVELRPGDLQGSLTILGDVTGELTEGLTASVIISAGTKDAALSIVEQVDVTLDSLTLVGGNEAALLVTDSEGLTILNCILRGSHGDGARFERSVSGLFFNNLIYNNAGTGIRVLGTDDWFIINNTVYSSKDHGLYAGISLSTPSSNLFITNNIFNKNIPSGITVDNVPPSSLDGYFADFNLNSDGYGLDTPLGEGDVNGPGSASDPQFTFPAGGNFRTTATSPAVNGGDFDTDPDLALFLSDRSIQNDGTLDSVPVDLGYHYLVPATPTPRP